MEVSATYQLPNMVINFYQNDPQTDLRVEIKTKDLFFKTVASIKKDIEELTGLFGDRRVMALYGDGTPKDKTYVTSRIDIWCKRLKERDPYVAMCVHKNDETQTFVGLVIPGHSGEPGKAEVAGLLGEKYWNQGYGSKIAKVLARYLVTTVKAGFLLEGKTLHTITATARPDNYSCRILGKIGMEIVKQYYHDTYKSERIVYSISMQDLKKKNNEFEDEQDKV